ncbi:hypothetical protein, partial [Desulfolithobacter sp.]
MKSSVPPTHSLDEIEDLTLFADEEFDTDDVDLFEFTGIDDSPLTRLKSIILSLDWEINDETLQELSDETASLRQLWQGDKIAQVYLQGLEKLGRYLQEEGAYAHPNAIKLLLTFYYDFEKIISSESITADEITTLLKTDVRKFKILQYQILQTQEQAKRPVSREDIIEETLTPPGEKDAEPGFDIAALPPLQGLKAAILGLDWEVTDKNLERFEAQVLKCLDEYQGNEPATILLQGLYILGQYIGEKRSEARPEAFPLLDNFHEGLTRLIEHPDLDKEEQEKILIDRVGRFNTLKAMVAGIPIPTAKTSQAEDPDDLDQTKGKPSDDKEPVLSTAGAVMGGSPSPEDELDADAIQPLEDRLADEFIEEELKISSDLTSALPDSDISQREDNLLPEDQELSESIEEQFDLFFSDDESADLSKESLVEPALNDAPQPSQPEAATEDDELDIQSDIEKKLDLLFGEEDADLAFEVDQEDDRQKTATDMADLLDDEMEREQPPALADVMEEKPDENEALSNDEEIVAMEIEEKLDFFFSEEEDEAVSVPAAEEKMIATEKVLDKTRTSSETPHDSEIPAAVEEESSEPEPALASTEPEENEQAGVPRLQEDTSTTEDLEERLDAFFGSSEPLSQDEASEPLALEQAEIEASADSDDELVKLEEWLARLPESMDAQQRDEFLAQINRLQEKQAQDNTVVLLQLLSSLLTMLPEDDRQVPGETGDVCLFLLQGSRERHDTADFLLTAVKRFTDWQKSLV